MAGHLGQGFEDLCSSTTEERAAVIRAWYELNKHD